MHTVIVPVCSTVDELYPSMPTQNAAYRCAATPLQLAAGTIQEPSAELNDEPSAA